MFAKWDGLIRHRMLIIAMLLAIIFPAVCFSMENILYVLHDKHQAAIASIAEHLTGHDILLAQAYRVNHTGDVSGSIDADILQFSQSRGIKLMAMVTNSRFDPKSVHQFLLNSRAQQQSLQSILHACQENHLYGVQFDFEMVSLADRDRLTQYYQAAADLLHANQFFISFAVAPIIMDHGFSSYYQKRLYEIWQGAYDLKRLGRIADFITVMAYDQHADGTMPGPIASIVWDQAVIRHALQSIPAEKLSLGVPTYSGLWYLGRSGKHIHMKYDAISFEKVGHILRQGHAALSWDPVNQIYYAYDAPNWMNRFIFIEDAWSFQAKVALAKKYHLRGISVFRLGIEDPRIWDDID